MDRRTLEWFDLLARALVWSAGIVLILTVIGAIAIGSSSSSLPVVGDLQRENRGVLTVAALGGGIAAAGVLAGLGAILRLMLADRVRRQELEDEQADDLGVGVARRRAQRQPLDEGR